MIQVDSPCSPEKLLETPEQIRQRTAELRMLRFQTLLDPAQNKNAGVYLLLPGVLLGFDKQPFVESIVGTGAEEKVVMRAAADLAVCRSNSKENVECFQFRGFLQRKSRRGPLYLRRRLRIFPILTLVLGDPVPAAM